MDEADWAQALLGLDLAATELRVLGRLLGVSPQLTAWRTHGDEAEGAMASDALDQALGLLDELSNGGAAELARIVRALLGEVPPVIE